MSRALAALLALAALAVVAAGCGGAGSGSANATYTAKGTVPCLRTKGFEKVTTKAAKLGLIAAAATNGGIRATAKSGNVVTIAFTGGSDSVAGTERAFKRFAKGVYKDHLRDVLRTQGNAVLVWTVTPKPGELNDALACLHA